MAELRGVPQTGFEKFEQDLEAEVLKTYVSAYKIYLLICADKTYSWGRTSWNPQGRYRFETKMAKSEQIRSNQQFLLETKKQVLIVN